MAAITSNSQTLDNELQSQVERRLLWANQLLMALGETTTNHLIYHALPGDAGFRRYFRVRCEQSLQTWLLVYSPPSTEPNQTFMALASGLRKNGVPTPKILGIDTAQGWFLIEDFGDQWLLSALQSQPEHSGALYSMAVDILLDLQCITPTALGYTVPEYDHDRLVTEMQLMPHWFSEQLLGYVLSPSEQQMFDELQQHLIQSALAQPTVLVHRDYHARNLMLTPTNTLGVIDFQDAVWGPITYDVASLFRDCYHRWPSEQVKQWGWQYAQKAMENGLLDRTIDEQTFQTWLDWMGLQRHIKVLGVFARLAIRDGKERYLNDLPLVIRYTLEVAESYPETREFAVWLRQTLLPRAEKHVWYRDVNTAEGQF